VPSRASSTCVTSSGPVPVDACYAAAAAAIGIRASPPPTGTGNAQSATRWQAARRRRSRRRTGSSEASRTPAAGADDGERDGRGASDGREVASHSTNSPVYNRPNRHDITGHISTGQDGRMDGWLGLNVILSTKVADMSCLREFIKVY